MKKQAFALMLFLALLISTMAGIMHYGTVQADTNVTGIISSDTTWIQANSPYTLTGNVLVDNGVTLTIQAGTIVNLSSYYIMINGTLQALGDSTNPIIFNGGQITFTQYSSNWTESTGAGCIIQNAIISSDITLGNLTKINYDTISGSITDSSLLYSTTGEQSIISNSTITGGIHVVGNETISNNIILNQGISPWGTATVYGNIISGCSVGIRTFYYPKLIENLIVNNTVGIEMDNWGSTQCPIIQNNTITENTDGISFPEYWSGDAFSPSIFNNNIYANTNYNVNSEVPYDINATYNWWGTTNTQAISQTIYDFNDDFNVGTVDFVPFLSEQNPAAPVIPTFTITASTGDGGSITPAGAIIVNWGETQAFSIVASTGYHILDVLVNGTSVGAVSSYTFDNVQASYTISATFAPDPTPSPSPTPPPTPPPSATPTPPPMESPSPEPTVPEFPSWIILPIFMIVTLIALLYFKKRKRAG